MLECVSGFLEGRRWASETGIHSFKVGRDQDADIAIPSELLTISSEHLVFENEPLIGWTVADTVS